MSSKDMTSYAWPARSPDLSPIEHVCDAGKGNCSRRDTGELTAQMQRLWQDLPQGKRSVMSRRKQRSDFDQVSELYRGSIVTYREIVDHLSGKSVVVLDETKQL
ncbi:hypothetical protein TNCV_124841 [Trichonephila clavipes]|nr:hypothetical protein TNCV_124841 [Trichonephila clavipes]